jgi:hypothetical protein
MGKGREGPQTFFEELGKPLSLRPVNQMDATRSVLSMNISSIHKRREVGGTHTEKEAEWNKPLKEKKCPAFGAVES